MAIVIDLRDQKPVSVTDAIRAAQDEWASTGPTIVTDAERAHEYAGFVALLTPDQEQQALKEIAAKGDKPALHERMRKAVDRAE